MGNFDKQVVICLANNLHQTATAISNKQRVGRTSAIIRYGDWRGGLPTEKLSQEENTEYHLGGVKSRMVIVAHGNEESTVINGRQTGKDLAEFVEALLDEKIGRITLHICFGGGRVGPRWDWKKKPSEQMGSFTVSPYKSIAYDFASHAGSLTYQVTARTDEVAGSFNPDTLGGFQRSVGGSFARRLGDKLVLTTDPESSPTKMKAPSASFNTKAPAVAV